MRLLTLKIEARAEAQTSLDEILNRAVDEDGRDLTEAEDATLIELRAGMEKLDGQIAVLQKDQERSEAASKVHKPLPRKTDNTPSTQVEVRSEPGTYGDGPEGFRRMLIDMAVSQGMHQSTDKFFSRAETQGRTERYAFECAGSGATTEVRAIAQANLGGIVNPQYDPSMVSRGIYNAGVTLSRLRRYPVWSTGDSITMPRVTTKASTGVQTENAAHTASALVTSAVKADLFTVSAAAPISIQSAERGILAVELLADEMMRSWIEELNRLVLTGDGTGGGGEPQGLLRQTGLAAQFIEKDDAAPSGAKALDYMTDAKTAVWKAVRRRITDLITSPGVIGIFEKVATNGVYAIPPYPAWAMLGAGGAGGLPEREGAPPEMEWRRVPVCADPAIPDTVTDTGSSYTTGAQSRIIALVSDAVPVFFDGPMSYTYDQTLAASGQLLLVARGYAAFNPLWRPEGYRVVYGTGLVLGA